MRTNALLAILSLTVSMALNSGATTIQSQDLPNNLTLEGTQRVNTRLMLGPSADLMWPDGSVSTSAIGGGSPPGIVSHPGWTEVASPFIFSSSTIVTDGINFSTGTRGLGRIAGSLDDYGGLVFISSTNQFVSVYNFTTDSTQLYIAFSSSVHVNDTDTSGLFYSSMTGIDLGYSDPGGATSQDLELGRRFIRLNVGGTNTYFELQQSSAVLSTNFLNLGRAGGTVKTWGNTTDLSQGDVLINATINRALCMNASGKLSSCTSTVGAAGGCTCP